MLLSARDATGEARIMSAQLSEADQKKWRKVPFEGHPGLTIMHRIFRYLPSPPRCKLCHNPFGDIGGKLAGLAGFKLSRKNPRLRAS
jgi:adenylate cyclase